ncbi:MAG TPA: bacteriophage holin [Pseudonocardiaceae bacterium]
MPFVPILIGLLAVGLVLLILVGLRIRGSVRRFGQARRALDGYVADRGGMVRARSAALGVAVSTRGPHSELGIGRKGELRVPSTGA